MKHSMLKRSFSVMLAVIMFCTVFTIPLGENTVAAAGNKKIKADGDPITVTLNPDGGTVPANSITAIEGSTYTGLPTPVKTGYKFLGWFAFNGAKVDNGIAVDVTYTTLTAKWEGNKYTVKYAKNKGKLSKKKKTVTFGNQYGALPKPKRKGYVFAGWYTQKKGGVKITKSSIVNIAKTHTIYARWGKITKVKFNGNGGTVGKKSKTIKQTKTYGKLPKAKRSGYVFKGWFTKKSGGKQITSSSVVNKSKNSTLYAQWAKVVKVNFDATGGSVGKLSKKVGHKSTYGELPIPTKASERGYRTIITYRFVGWYTLPTGGVNVTSTTKVTNKKEHTLYAHWLKLTVRY